MLRLSSGTASLLGLSPGRLDAPPTTAYILVGERCQRDCAFCTQAKSSLASAQALSRVLWPAFEEEEALSALRRAYLEGKVQRACLQVTVSPDYLQRTKALAARLGLPTCASVVAFDQERIGDLLDSGLEIVCLSLDGANEEVYRRVKGGDFSPALLSLEGAAQRFPGRIATHLIVGLGEKEEEMARLIQRLHDMGVIVALFAFTPVPGTALEHRPPPPLAAYRRLQIARYLMVQGLARAESFSFTSKGEISHFGLGAEELRRTLSDGKAFETSGCPGCNRPYYNERPGGPLYNYPRPLKAEEVAEALAKAGLSP